MGRPRDRFLRTSPCTPTATPSLSFDGMVTGCSKSSSIPIEASNMPAPVFVNTSSATAFVQRMSRKANCRDNAVAESFFHSLKNELIHHSIWYGYRDVHAALFRVYLSLR